MWLKRNYNKNNKKRENKIHSFLDYPIVGMIMFSKTCIFKNNFRMKKNKNKKLVLINKFYFFRNNFLF